MAGLLRSHVGFRRLWIGDGLSKIGSQVTPPGRARARRHRARRLVPGRSPCSARSPTRRCCSSGCPSARGPTGCRRRRVLVGADLARAAALLSVPGRRTARPAQHGAAVRRGVRRRRGHGRVRRVPTAPTCPGWSAGIAWSRPTGGWRSTARWASRPVRPSAGRSSVGSGPRSATLASAIGFVWSALWIAAIRTPEAPPAGAVPAERRLVERDPRGPAVRADRAVHPGDDALRLRGRRLPRHPLRGRDAVPAPRRRARPGLDRSARHRLGHSAASPARSRRRRWPDATARCASVAGSAVAMGAASLLIPLTRPGLGTGPVRARGWPRRRSGSWSTASSASAAANALCPDHLLGRMNATSRFVSWATLPLGGVLGGAARHAAPVARRPVAHVGRPRGELGLARARADAAHDVGGRVSRVPLYRARRLQGALACAGEENRRDRPAQRHADQADRRDA